MKASKFFLILILVLILAFGIVYSYPLGPTDLIESTAWGILIVFSIIGFVSITFKKSRKKGEKENVGE